MFLQPLAGWPARQSSPVKLMVGELNVMPSEQLSIGISPSRMQGINSRNCIRWEKSNDGQRWRVLPGDVNPKQALLVTNFDFSRRLPSGVSLSFYSQNPNQNKATIMPQVPNSTR